MSAPRPKVVIVGAGFGGIEAARALAKSPVDVTIVDRQNHHCFQPLLYQVATAALSPADVAWPIRHIFRHQANATVLMARVEGVDTRRRVLLAFERAELAADDAERRRLLTFVIVGAGATGVEMAGAIAEVARQTLAMDFRNIDPRTARIALIEAGPRAMPTLPEDLSDYVPTTPR